MCVVLFRINFRLSNLTKFLLQLTKKRSKKNRVKKRNVLSDDRSIFKFDIDMIVKHSTQYGLLAFLLQINHRLKERIVKF